MKTRSVSICVSSLIFSHFPLPPIRFFRSAFLNAGYCVSFSHAALSSIKTDAPMSFIWDVICAWKRKYTAELATPSPPPSPAKPKQGDAEAKDNSATKKAHKKTKHPPSEAALRVVDALMARPENPNIDFTLHPGYNPASRAEGLKR